jgi:hypothetical protein
MRLTICLAIAALFLCGTISCSKINIEPHPRKPGDSTLVIDLIYPNTDTTGFSGTNFELIISEPGGRILLDTIAPYNAPIIATMKTAELLVDVSTVVHFPSFDGYSAIVYKSVKPEQWMTLPGNPIPLFYPNAIPATITYTNVPQADPNTIHFGSLPTNNSNGANITYDNPDNQIDISYEGLSGNNFAYLLFPTLGLYSYQMVPTSSDTISLSQMDSTVKVFYNMPSQYSLSVTYMTGYLDTTDFTKNLSLYSYYAPLPLGDLQYPPHSVVPVQKYALDVDASTANGEYLSYRTFGATPPSGTLTLPLPAIPIYTLNSTANDSFSVSFSQRPTNYGTNWSTGNINMSIIASPDSTQIRPLPLLTSLHSKLLQGQTLSTLTLQNFNYENIPGVDYNSYYLHQTNSAQVTKNPFASDLLYLKFVE